MEERLVERIAWAIIRVVTARKKPANWLVRRSREQAKAALLAMCEEGEQKEEMLRMFGIKDVKDLYWGTQRSREPHPDKVKASAGVQEAGEKV